MCFYDSYTYSCKDWKWGNFVSRVAFVHGCAYSNGLNDNDEVANSQQVQHCNKEYRMGETCGMKMVYETQCLSEKCKMCIKIETKERRMLKHKNDVIRWTRDDHPERYKASIAKAIEDMKDLRDEINTLKSAKEERYRNVGNPRR